MAIAASAYKVSGDDTAGGERVASLTESTIRVDFAGSVVGVSVGARVARPVAVGIELVTAAGGAEGFAASFNAGFVAVALIGGDALNAESIVAVWLGCIQTSAVILAATTCGGTDVGTARSAQGKQGKEHKNDGSKAAAHSNLQFQPE